ncbi:hypothetical protein NUU61_006851 [Penicillium alfredii]|uniref:Major facilitator superfamily (MFS) profile domain-containing protein n=1 Tax=Penicillium alfredii TaxID=1506179 RepID=A0A9W9K461_9EURO|nr:uncharacterized protein NUU61_006851 [Penicillium alfredii]KAJ5091981.1 hypothetical protein NUU61_006851 [Penicillium alfredii]
MGRYKISRDIFDDEPKPNFGARTSVQSVDLMTPLPTLGSAIQLFDSGSPSEEERRPEVRDWLVFICIVILAVMDSFDATVLIPAVPDLANTFEKPMASTLWVNTAYLVLGSASQVFFTMLCEVFSHGPIWIFAVVLTTIGTGICCGSMSLVELLVGRTIQGIGGGGAMSLCFVAVAESAPEPIHSRYACYILLTRMVGTIMGPMIGGLFVDYANWTWGFYFNFIFAALGLLVIPFAIDLRVSKNIPMRRLRTLDWPGASLAFLGPGAILLGLSWGGIFYRWDQWQTFTPIVIGVALILVLMVYESKWALHPQFGARVFRSRMMVMTYLGCFLHSFVMFCQLQYFPFYFISTKYMLTALSGVTLVAITGFAIGPAAVAGVILATESHCAQWIITGGWILTTLAAGCCILLDETTPTVGWIFLFFTAGLGHGLLLSGYNIRIQNTPKDAGASPSNSPTTMAIFMRSWGMAVAIPVGGAVMLNCFGIELASINLDRDLVNAANGYLILMRHVQMSGEQREALKTASAGALRVVWGLIAGTSALGGISSAFLWRRRL